MAGFMTTLDNTVVERWLGIGGTDAYGLVLVVAALVLLGALIALLTLPGAARPRDARS
ncbi:MAG TPA: hypothetical protein VM347_20455 [Nonomuraea sp.]|nr:hypothetical protein [Nonomuraea sp.]